MADDARAGEVTRCECRGCGWHRGRCWNMDWQLLLLEDKPDRLEPVRVRGKTMMMCEGCRDAKKASGQA